MALKWDQSERSQNFRYKVTAVFVRGLFSKFFPRCGKRWQMRCRLILLITEHPIQQGIRKGGVRHFCDEDEDEDGRTEWRILGSWILGIDVNCILCIWYFSFKRTSWARAGPSGSSPKSTQKSLFICIPPFSVSMSMMNIIEPWAKVIVAII